MKKVIHVITTISRGGAENQLITLVREQIKSDWNVTVVYLKDEPELFEEFINNGVEVLTDCSKYGVIGQIRWLRNYFKYNNCIIHAHLPRAELLTALAAQRNSFVVTRHNAEKFFPRAPQLISSLLSRFVTKRARSLIAISRAVEIFIRSKKEVSKNFEIVVIYYGFNKIFPNLRTHQMTRNDVNLRKEDFVFGTIGRIVPQKDYITLLKAFSLVSKDKEDFKLLVIGDGILKLEMQKLANMLGISHKVVWFGRTERIMETLKLMDCFVFTSRYEGFGLVLLEAMSAEIPIIASNISAIPEVLGNDYPLLSIPGDALDFAEKMSRVVSYSSEELKILLDLESNQLKNFDPFLMNKAVEKVYGLI